jgi:hypothetical protein
VSRAVIVRMWEVRAHPEAMGELLSWVCEAALPSLEVNPLYLSGEVFSSTDNRVVAIVRWRSNPQPMPDPPGHLVARPPHVWDFSPVDR